MLNSGHGPCIWFVSSIEETFGQLAGGWHTLVRGECLLGVEILGGLPNTSGSTVEIGERHSGKLWVRMLCVLAVYLSRGEDVLN